MSRKKLERLTTPPTEDTEVSPDARRDGLSDKGKTLWEHPFLLGCVALLGSFVAAYINGYQNRSLERDKIVWSANSEISGQITSAHYEVGSFLESVQYHPDQIDELFQIHEERMKAIMPRVVAAHAAIGSRDQKQFLIFGPIVREVSTFDRCVTEVYRSMSGVPRVAALAGVFKMQAAALGDLGVRLNTVIQEGRGVPVVSFPGGCTPPEGVPTK